jgi:hypothetical protein
MTGPPAYFEFSDWSVGSVTRQARQVGAGVAAGQLGNLNRGNSVVLYAIPINVSCSFYFSKYTENLFTR